MKHHLWLGFRFRLLSLPVRGRGLKRRFGVFRPIDLASLPVRGRGLKPLGGCEIIGSTASLPVRGRGLKRCPLP